jgi:hypothetical protein
VIISLQNARVFYDWWTAIYNANGNGIHALSALNNSIDACDNGILVTQAISDGIIANDTFPHRSLGHSINGITSANHMTNMAIVNNVATNACVNGVQIATCRWCDVPGFLDRDRQHRTRLYGNAMVTGWRSFNWRHIGNKHLSHRLYVQKQFV